MSWLRPILLVFMPLAAGYYLSYLFRIINAVVAAPLVDDLGLDATRLGLLSWVYFLTFAAVQLPLGAALDRFGPRRVQGTLPDWVNGEQRISPPSPPGNSSITSDEVDSFANDIFTHSGSDLGSRHQRRSDALSFSNLPAAVAFSSHSRHLGYFWQSRGTCDTVRLIGWGI